MKYLIAVDSDGTLRHSDGTISKETKTMISKIKDKGHTIVICTARPRYHTLKVALEVGSSTYLISSNGTEVYDNVNDQVIYSSYLPKKSVQKIYCDIENMAIRAIFVCDDIEYVTQFTRNVSQILLTGTNYKEMLSRNIKQIMIIDKDKTKVNKYKEIVKNNYNLNIIDKSNDNLEETWFSIISRKASKGIALKKLSEYLGISINNTIAIGNDKNDIPMFEVAGISVAVKNAPNDIKDKVDYVVPSNDEDGVVEFLKKILKYKN